MSGDIMKLENGT
jgi:hypothetical protein